MAGERSRKPNSECIAFSTWTPLAKTVASGKKRPSLESRGQVFLIFHRAFPRYAYTLTKPFTLREWMNWMRGRVGEKWNERYLGRV